MAQKATILYGKVWVKVFCAESILTCDEVCASLRSRNATDCQGQAG
jgi:hypothetical protein